jgi:uncharacterized caspase-like protein
MPQKIAVIIGVGDYPQEVPEAQRLKRLPKAVPDAEAVAAALGDPALGGFAVTLLKNPTKAAMENAINQAFASTRAKDDLVLLYFSGHGVKDLGGRFYLTSAETYKESDGNPRKASALSAAVCHDLLRDCPARRWRRI